MKRRIALISVYHKDGIIEFCKELRALNFDLIASSGTFKHLTEAGLHVINVASLVGGDPILGHRVVTLSREVHAGLLAKNVEQDREELSELNIPYIDLVCVDLYPLQAEINKPSCTSASVIEQTDIGGPTMLRSAAKGRRIVVCDPNDRTNVIDWLKSGTPNEKDFLNMLAAKAEYIVAQYCLLSAGYHGQGEYKGFIGQQHLTCKYGENGYQTPAALYKNNALSDELALHNFQLSAGSEPSYNNLCDVDRLLQTATHIAATFDKNRQAIPFMALGAKHGNLCGAGINFKTEELALVNMLEGDPVSLFGGIIMLNFVVSENIAELIVHEHPDKKRLLDGIVAPGFSEEAIEILARKKGKCRLLCNPALSTLNENSLDHAEIHRYVRGGFLAQPNYSFIPELDGDYTAAYFVSEDEENDILLAKAICDTSNSNTITLVKEGQLIGNGVGQQSRVRAARFAIEIAKECGHETAGAVAASDSFFPYVDGPETLADAGIISIITSSGSINDSAVRAFCKQKGITLFMVPDSVGRGFFNH